MVSGFLFGLTACEDPLKIGSDLLPAGSQAGVFFSDTFTVRSSTVLLDSIQTSGTTALLLGRYTDPVLGAVEARSFVQLAPDSGDTLKADPKAVYDSLVLVLPYNGFSYGDTTRYQTVNVHRLTDTLDNGKTYLTTSNASFEATALGRARYKPNLDPNIAPSLRVKLSDAFGRELFALAGKPESTDAKAFRNYLKGLALVSGTGDEGSVLGVSSSNVGLYVYYHVDTLRKFYGIYALPRASSTTAAAPTVRFTRVVHQRTGALATLTQPGQAVSSSRTNDEVYLQQAGGLGVKVEFPTLKNLRNLPQGRVAINQADLFFEPKLPVPTNVNLPAGVSLIESNETNLPLRTAQYQIRYVLTEQTTTTPQTAPFDGTNERYAFNVTSQLQQMLTGQRTATGLLLTREAPQTSSGGYIVNALFGTDVRRAVFDARRIKLRVYYTISNN